MVVLFSLYLIKYSLLTTWRLLHYVPLSLTEITTSSGTKRSDEAKYEVMQDIKKFGNVHNVSKTDFSRVSDNTAWYLVVLSSSIMKLIINGLPDTYIGKQKLKFPPNTHKIWCNISDNYVYLGNTPRPTFDCTQSYKFLHRNSRLIPLTPVTAIHLYRNVELRSLVWPQ